ncbi:Uncharacterised protein [Moraxella cuniculi]|uniref:Uncharacterized protein n=1 Tax=Moraxella cuniculi TaxID=34061 RepID=A0A3S4QPR2_9GAMM|nr:Uncharacterised protein [Moraxella cuniculi]
MFDFKVCSDNDKAILSEFGTKIPHIQLDGQFKVCFGVSPQNFRKILVSKNIVYHGRRFLFLWKHGIGKEVTVSANLKAILPILPKPCQ